VVTLACRRSELVHDAAVAADELVLGFLSVHRQVGGTDLEPVQALEDVSNGHLQGCRRRKSGTLGHVAGDGDVGSTDRQASQLQVLDNTTHI
jgi:hypothetical protein